MSLYELWKSASEHTSVSAEDLRRTMNDLWSKLVSEQERQPYPAALFCPDCGEWLGYLAGPISMTEYLLRMEAHRFDRCYALVAGDEMQEQHETDVWERLQRRWASKHPTPPFDVIPVCGRDLLTGPLRQFMDVKVVGVDSRPAPTEAICASCGERYQKVPLPPVIHCGCGTTITVA